MKLPRAINFKLIRTRKYTSRIQKKNQLKMRLKQTDVRNLITIINVYAPHSGLEESELDDFYEQLNSVISEVDDSRTAMLILAGDWNAKVGKVSNENREQCVGNWSRGKRNRSGEKLVAFCTLNNLFIANSAFQHSARHITTWENKRIMKNGEVITVYNQIDFILVKQNQKNVLENARDTMEL